MAEAKTYAGTLKHTTDKNKWEYVTVPEKDIFDNATDGFDLNHDHFGPGVHFVPPEVADSMKRIIRTSMDADIRILQPKKHLKSLIESGLMRSTPAGKSEVLTKEDE